VAEGIDGGDQEGVEPGGEEADAEGGGARQDHPCLEQQEVEGRMDVGGAVGQQVGEGRGRQMDADGFVPPDGLGV